MSAEELTSNQNPRVSIVGVGGAGNNLLARAIGGGISPNGCVAVNTDRGQLSRSPARNKVLLGDGSEESALGNPENSAALQNSAYRVRPFTDESDFTIVVAGLGGATGTGTAPLIAQWARTQIRPVISVVAIPFIHERERRFLALRGLKRMVEACNCTVVVDNAMENGLVSTTERVADERASLAVRNLAEVMSEIGPGKSRDIFEIMSLGSVATICSSYMRPGKTLQTAVLEALRKPSAALPLSKAQGAVMLYRGPEKIGDGQAAMVYETLVSLIGHEIEFFNASIRRPSDPTVCLLLTGYDYGTTVRAFVDFIEDLYDVEYGQSTPGSFSGLRLPLFQMEQA